MPTPTIQYFTPDVSSGTFAGPVKNVVALPNSAARKKAGQLKPVPLGPASTEAAEELKRKGVGDAFEGGPGTTKSAANLWYDARSNEREAILVENGISIGQACNWSGEAWMKLPNHVQAAWRAQGKVVKILKHEFTNPRTGHVDTSYSCAEQPAHAKDVASEVQLVLAVERAKKRYETARGAVGLAEEARKRMRGLASRLQSPRESKARTKALAACMEVNTAERALKEFQDAKVRSTDSSTLSNRRARLHRALDRVLGY